MEVAKRLDPFQEDLDRLDTIPGIVRRTAEQKWVGLVPGQNESAGKRKSSKTRKGNKYLRSALIEVSHTLRGSDNYLGAQYRRMQHERASTERLTVTLSANTAS
jgi:transposase